MIRDIVLSRVSVISGLVSFIQFKKVRINSFLNFISEFLVFTQIHQISDIFLIVMKILYCIKQESTYICRCSLFKKSAVVHLVVKNHEVLYSPRVPSDSRTYGRLLGVSATSATMKCYLGILQTS